MLALFLASYHSVSSSSAVMPNTFAKAFTSMSVTNLFPHSIRCIAFLSRSIPSSCSLSARPLCDTAGLNFILSADIFFPLRFNVPSEFLFLYTFSPPKFDILYLSTGILCQKRAFHKKDPFLSLSRQIPAGVFAKHSLQRIGRSFFGLKGTTASAPHCAQVVVCISLDDLIASFLDTRQSLQRPGSFWKPFSA